MQRVDYSGVLSGVFLLPVTALGDVVITIILDSTDPAMVADGVRLVQGTLLPGLEYPINSSDFDVYAELESLSGYGVLTASTTLFEGGPRSLGVIVDSGFTDEDSYWTLRIIISGLDTAPLVFEPQDLAMDEIAESIVTPGVFYNTGPTRLYHQNATSGLLTTDNSIQIIPAARSVTLGPGLIQHVNLATGEIFLLGEILADPITGAPPAFTLDRARIPAAQFELAEPLSLDWLDATATHMMLDERGVVFGFYAMVPEVIGGFLFAADAEAGRPEGVIAATGEIVGPPRWRVASVEDAHLLGALTADLADVVVRWDEAASELRWQGDIILRDFVAEGVSVAFGVVNGRGFFSNATQEGLDGDLAALGQVKVSLAGQGIPFAVVLNALTMSVAEDDLALTTGLSYEFGWGRIHLPVAEAAITVDRTDFELRSLAFTLDTIALPTIVPGLFLTHFDGGLFDLEPDDGAPARFAAEMVLELLPAPGETALARLTLDGAATRKGYEATATLEVGMVGGAPIFYGAGGMLVSRSELSGAFAGSFALPLLGDVAATEIVLATTRQDSRAFWLSGEVEVTAPATLVHLLGLYDAVIATRLAGMISAGAPSESWLEFLGSSDTAAFGAMSFGFRFSLDGGVELLGGIGFLGADPGAAAQRGASAEPGRATFSLDRDAPALAMRAEGDVDAEDVTVVGPDGTRYGAAEFAARGIAVVLDDAAGITLRVTDAEAGDWVLEAPTATGFAGFADMPDPVLTVQAALVEGAPGLRATASLEGGVPAEGFHWRVLADTDAVGFDGVVVYSAPFDGRDTLEFAFDALGLAPGDWHLHVEVGGSGLATARAYLPGSVSITGAADLALQADLVWPTEWAEFPQLLLRIENQGDVAAIGARVAANLAGFADIELPLLAPGAVLVIDSDALRDLGVTRDLRELELFVSHPGHESDPDDNVALAVVPREGDLRVPAALVVVQEDEAYEASLLDLGVGIASAAIVAGPIHGTVTLGADGVFVYVPAADFSGGDVFTWRATGEAGDSVEARVWISVAEVNDAPVLVAPLPDRVAGLGAPVSLDLPGGLFRDVDGDLSYALLRQDGTALPGWMRFDSATGLLQGLPGLADAGPIALRLVAQDWQGLTAADDFVLTIAPGRLGTDAADNLRATTGDDTVFARGGNDTVQALAGADSVLGEAGRDRLIGHDGDDLLLGGGDDDRLFGGEGADTLSGGTGRDVLLAGPGRDLFLLASGAAGDVALLADFTPGEDLIALSAAALHGALTEGADLAGHFLANLTGRPRTADPAQIVYETDAGRLWWHAEGDAGPAVLLAVLRPGPSVLTEADLVIVA